MPQEKLVPFEVKVANSSLDKVVAAAVAVLGYENGYTEIGVMVPPTIPPRRRARFFRDVPKALFIDDLDRFVEENIPAIEVEDFGPDRYKVNVADDTPQPLIEKLRSDFTELFGKKNITSPSL